MLLAPHAAGQQTSNQAAAWAHAALTCAGVALGLTSGAVSATLMTCTQDNTSGLHSHQAEQQGWQTLLQGWLLVLGRSQRAALLHAHLCRGRPCGSSLQGERTHEPLHQVKGAASYGKAEVLRTLADGFRALLPACDVEC